MNTNLRGIDPDLWRQLRAQAALRNLPLGTLVNQAISLLLDQQNGRATSPQPAPESSAPTVEIKRPGDAEWTPVEIRSLEIK